MGEEKKVMFHEMELDDRIIKAVAQLAWSEPTLIQETAIPLLLEGKDVLMRARTGSGKTAAFTIPVIQKILHLNNTSEHQCIRALILSPSKELCGQITSVIADLTLKCAREVRCIDISANGDMQTQKALLSDKPDIVVATPSKALAHLKANNMRLKDDLAMLVVDEADLVFPFGYEDEIKELLGHLPKIYQAVLASATLSDDVLSLKKIGLRNPVTLKLEDQSWGHHHSYNTSSYSPGRCKSRHFVCPLKLNLVRGKSIIFVRTVDRCYKLKLYLEQFKIGSCVLNSELPAAVRCLSVDQFNRGRYQIIVASDEKALEKPDGGILPIEERQKKKKQASKRKRDKESGVSRGIDFQHVSNVINFDFPLDVNSYVHRAGRTARGNNSGSVLSFVSIREKPLMDPGWRTTYQGGVNGQKVLQKYEFALEEVEGFRYRSRDPWRAVTRIAVREARLKEIKQELLNCKKLQGYFEENPTDLAALRRDKALHTVRVQPQLAHVPEYLLPHALRTEEPEADAEAAEAPAPAPQKKRRQGFGSAKRHKYQARQNNPLRSFNVKSVNKTPATGDT
uniref:RNA helicase n=1 Tax=Choristoneura fumiferana TaxID=7141 RepID=Q6SC69_CHOFU|nr:RNA helicase [Choristoneura fumiferana]